MQTLSSTDLATLLALDRAGFKIFAIPCYVDGVRRIAWEARGLLPAFYALSLHDLYIGSQIRVSAALRRRAAGLPRTMRLTAPALTLAA